MVHVRRVCLFLMVAFLSFQASEGFCQLTYSISNEMYDRCEEAIAAYVKKIRNWDRGSYKISFSGRYDLYNVAAFGVTSKAYIEELERKKGTGGGFRCELHPDDFVLLVDIVDYVVLGENRIDTYFPNAKPGYERAVPYTPPK